MTDKLNLIPAAANEEHLARHTDNTSLNPGSKAAIPGLKAEMMKILSACDAQYAKQIEEKGNPGRVVIGIKAPLEMGTDAVMPVSALASDAQEQIFNMTRDTGTPYEQKIRAVITKPEDMPRTNIIHAVYGPYGASGNAGIYTVLYGDEGMPFPRKTSPESSKEEKEFNQKCQQYWDNHIFLVTPDEVKHCIKEMQKSGKEDEAKAIEANLTKFKLNNSRGTYVKPCTGSYHSQISENAVKLDLKEANSENKDLTAALLRQNTGKE